MTLTARINGPLRDITGQESTLACSSSTLGALIEEIDTRFPGFRAATAPNGALGRFINVHVDGSNARGTRELDSPTPPDSVVIFDLAVSGG